MGYGRSTGTTTELSQAHSKVLDFLFLALGIESKQVRSEVLQRTQAISHYLKCTYIEMFYESCIDLNAT